MHGTSTQQVVMDMKNRLPRLGTAIDHDAESGLIESIVLRQAVGSREDGTDEFLVLFIQFQNSRVMFFRYDEEMHRRLWVDVTDSKNAVAVIYLFGWDIPLLNLAKQAIAHTNLSKKAPKTVLPHQLYHRA